MTVKELLDWCLRAYDEHDDSYSDVDDKHMLCKKQAIVKTRPDNAMEGEQELAIAIVFGNTYQEIAEMKEMCWQPKECVPCDPATPAQPVPVNAWANPSPAVHFAEIRQTIRAHNEAILSTPDRAPLESPGVSVREVDVCGTPPVEDDIDREIDGIIAELEAETEPEHAARMVDLSEQVSAHMADVLSRPVDPSLTIPMDLRYNEDDPRIQER